LERNSKNYYTYYTRRKSKMVICIGMVVVLGGLAIAAYVL
jgi:hypothetical protein